jgi:hypothetical protein
MESAITAIQSTSDGGSRPTSDAETLAKSIITTLQGIDTNLQNLAAFMGATSADKQDAEIDAYRETKRLRSMGRMYVHRLARMFDTYPRSDIFSTAPGIVEGYPRFPRTPY